MRFILAGITVSVLFFCSVSAAESPLFQTVTIAGKTKDIYNKVSLFEKGSSKKPLKTIQISQPDGTYSMVVIIPDEMRKKDNYFWHPSFSGLHFLLKHWFQVSGFRYKKDRRFS